MEEELKVLMVEDDEAVAEMYRLRLAADGYTVIVAPDGEAGLSLATSEMPDLIYLDLRLPKMDGFTVLEKLRASSVTANIPVVILSNYGEPELIERGLKLGALDFLVKANTTPAQLAEAAERWTESPTAGTVN